MPKGKHEYQIEINHVGEEFNSYSYKYGRISNIILDVSRDGIRATLMIGKEYSIDEILGYGRYYFFPDAIKKGLLIHLVTYSQEIDMTSLKVTIDGNTTIIDPGAKPVVYQLIDAPLLKPLRNPNWMNPEIIDGILKLTKTAQDGRVASLYALLFSKTKKFEAERFIYLWMAFNGLYGYVSDVAENIIPPTRKGKTQKIGDSEGIGLLLALYGWGHERVSAQELKVIARKVIVELINWDGNAITVDSLNSGAHQNLNTAIQPLITNEGGTALDISVYGYLLGYFAYYFRCDIIHADKPVPLYSYESEYEIKCLKLINQMLEDFLDENLYRYFDEAYRATLENEINRVIREPGFKVKKFEL